MQNVTENGFSEHHVSHQQQRINDDKQITPHQPGTPPIVDAQLYSENQIADQQQNDTEIPPAKRRKLTGPEPAKGPRPISPPWKRIEVEGPSTFLEGGVRKSARTNYVPIDLQAQSDKRKTRGAVQHGKSPTIKSKYGGASVSTSTPVTPSPVQASNGINGHRHTGSAGKASHAFLSKSPGRPKTAAAEAPKLSTDITNSQKRSHKKKSPLQFESPSTPQSPPAPNPHQPRKVGRPRRSSITALRSPQAVPANGWQNTEHELSEEEKEGNSNPDGLVRKPQRLSLRFHMPALGVHHPEHIVKKKEIVDGDQRRPKFSSFQDWLDREGRLGLEGEVDPHTTDEDAQHEARLRRRISEAARPGGVLGQDTCSYWQPEKSEETPRLYTHQDRLLAHMRNFHMLLGRERLRHLKAAKECAQQAAAFVKLREEKTYREWKREQPKTTEELLQEQQQSFKSTYEQLRDDLKQKWLMVVEVVEDLRLERWQTEQDRLGKEALNEAIEKSRGLLSKRRRRSSSEDGTDEDSREENSVSESSGQSNSDEDSENEDNMSSSQSDSEDEQNRADDDEGLTQEELRHKYGGIQVAEMGRPPDQEEYRSGEHAVGPEEAAAILDARSSVSNQQVTDSFSQDIRGPMMDLDEVDDTLLDNSDDSTEMDDDMGSSDKESSQKSQSSSEETEDDEGFGILGGFLSKREREEIARLRAEKETMAEPTQDSPTDFEGSDDEADKVSLIPDVTQGPTPSASPSEEPQAQDRNDGTQCSHNETPQHEIVNGAGATIEVIGKGEGEQGYLPGTADVHLEEAEMPATPVSTQTIKTPVPSLLRGQLREYQHYGLDWLAGLYANGTNGILADEMGLGKTIQTISLLAHLALHHEAWGPHLIVVPTSVMLNWEVEFKKFLPGFKVLTYYGNQEERKKKRAGWMDDDKWNVWITSYTLITQDQQIFKRKAWHYMILDEAHNIKNFQSLRWQTLLTFRTRARLLLTGTPLQNNLTELWSLLYFLMPSDNTGAGIAGFTNLEDFTGWFKKPTEQILEQGREALDAEARVAVHKLHDILRPYLLRRLKADVEKQMPAKYEHVIYCRLSKRQRYLYDGFMSRAQTRETLASGNTFSIMNALMQLRKVCNHPDLFETRQIVTSFAMPRSAVADFEIKELLVRRTLLQEAPLSLVDLNLVNLLPGANESMSALDTIQKQRLGALGTIRQLTSQQRGHVNWNFRFDGSSISHTLDHFENNACRLRYDKLHQTSYLTSLRSQRRPLYSHDLMERLRFGVKSLPHQPMPTRRDRLSDWYARLSPALSEMALTLSKRSEALESTVRKFACITPAVVATDMASTELSRKGVEVIREAQQACPEDAFHEARMRLSIAFPDKRLLQYDCGKLQKLDTLLRQLQAGGHRALIFTQMTRVLDILEQFMNIHGHRYLRLDGATKLEHRQVLTERFNNDNRILAFILSSRSGGIGINLTGADTVIFYDLDWNPAMDKQCQDRCHRIGQTRDVHIYRMISEHTIEANILRKANQKRMLDDVVIQEGEFTTQYFNDVSVKDIVDDESLNDADAAANAAMDRVLGNRTGRKVFEAVEDQDDATAAKEAEKEIATFDAEDFDERSAGATTPKTPAGLLAPGEAMPPPRTARESDVEMTTTMEAVDSGLATTAPAPVDFDLDIEHVPSCDEYMIRFLDWELQDTPVQVPMDKKKSKKKKGKESLGRKR